MHVRLKEI